ncbi:MAG: FAD-dependent oxidoreductase [Ignavibacteria bacterium]
MKDSKVILEKTEVICENTLAFTFDSRDTDYNFKAGQYAHFTLTDPKFSDERGNTRALSFANAPNEYHKFVIAARINSSVFIKNLQSLDPGSGVFISKPGGGLTLHSDSSVSAVFISGGIGITPLRSILEDMFSRKLPHRINLFYMNKKETQIAFMDDFEKWAGENKNFKFIPLIDDRENKNWKYEFGPFNTEMLDRYIKNIRNNIYYITGPAKLVDSVMELLLDKNVTPENIRIEKFK